MNVEGPFENEAAMVVVAMSPESLAYFADLIDAYGASDRGDGYPDAYTVPVPMGIVRDVVSGVLG